MVRGLRHGTVWLNDFGVYTAGAEWGGFKQSGLGRELGPDAPNAFTEEKNVFLASS